jgi:hypothetical protein
MSWLVFLLLLVPQQPAHPLPAAPPEAGVYLLSENGWVVLPPLKHAGIKLRGQGLWPITSLKHRAVYPGKTSTNAASSTPVFCVVGMGKDVAPEAGALRTKEKRGNRELQIWNLANMDAPQRPNTEDYFPLSVEQAGGCTLLRTQELAPGEYVLSLDGLPASNPVYDFSVPKLNKRP